MAKFVAMMDMLNLVVPYIERDEKGALVRDQSITFNTGIKTRDKVIPASILTNDPSTLKHLRSYGGNEANGGTSFREVAEKKSEAPEAKAPAKKADKVEDKEEVESEEEVNSENSYPEATTVQAASSILRELFPDLKSRDTDNKEKVRAVSAEKGISFPNLA